MSDFDLVTLKHEGTTICDSCHRMVGEHHASWCAYSPTDEVVRMPKDKWGNKEWSEYLDAHLAEHGETRDMIVACVTSRGSLVSDLDGVHPRYNDNAWTVWTATRVYFPAGYDSGYWVASVPRNPSDERVECVGGGC